MNFTFLIFILIVSEICLAIPSYYNGPTYSNEREIENPQMLSSHQKKRLLSDDNSQYREEQGQPEEEHAAAAGYESARFRKFQSGSAGDSAFSQRARLEHEQVEYEPEAKEKREYFEGNPAASKDSSIEVILDPKAKKAVAVVENSPTGQAMYDLTGWKNAKEDVSALDNDQYAQSNQEQVVNLVYPAERSANMERSERKYNPGAEAFEASNSERKYENFDGSSEYGGNRLVKAPAHERAAITETEQRLDDTHKKKRNAEMMKRNTLDTNVQLDSEKRSIAQEKRKTSSDSKQNECPPHNAPSSSGESATGDTSTENTNLNKDSADIKREASQHWTQNQIDALTSSVVKARDNNAEMGNLKAILMDMGLVDTQFPQKREISENEQENAIMNEKLDKINENKRDLQQKSEISEEEDANQENVMLKRNDREVNNNEDDKWEMDINDAPQEPIEKREIENDNAQENNEETENTNKDIKRSNDETAEAQNAEDDVTTRKKRQNSDKKNENVQQDAMKDVTSNIANIDSNVESLKKYNKREADDKPKEKRKLEEDEFEKKMENQIQAKIDAIKEKVKREILEEQRKRSKRYSINSTPDLTIVDKPNSRLRRESIADTSNLGSITANEKSQAYNKNTRKKRANILPEKQMIYRPFQAEQDDESEEDGEFDDNNFDNRIYLQKRQAADDDFQYFDARNREISPYMQPNYYPQSRNRRSFENDYSDAESSAFHSGGMMVNRKTNLKNKGFNDREKRGDTFTDQESENTDENENMENSDNEYFGSLPQAYNGELTRYKRVKRDNPYK